MWMRQNFLKLNSDKTEVIPIGTWQQLSKLQDFQAELYLTIGDTCVLPVEKARNLGVIFDSNLNLEAHVKNICCASYFHTQHIGQICSYLSQADIETLVLSLISSHLYQLNSLLYGLPDMLLKKYKGSRTQQHVWKREPNVMTTLHMCLLGCTGCLSNSVSASRSCS